MKSRETVWLPSRTVDLPLSAAWPRRAAAMQQLQVPLYRCCRIATVLASVMWTTVFAPQRSSFQLETDRIPRDPASIMFAMSRTVILDHRESTAVLASSALFLVGAFMLIRLCS